MIPDNFFSKTLKSRKLGILAHFHSHYQKLEVIPHRNKFRGLKKWRLLGDAKSRKPRTWKVLICWESGSWKFNLHGYGKKLKSNPGNWLSEKSVWPQLPSSIVQDWDTFDWIRRYHKVRKIELYKFTNFSKMRHPCAIFFKDEWKYRSFRTTFFLKLLNLDN